MAVVVPKLTIKLAESTDYKKDLLGKIGDLSGIEVFHNMILVGAYIRPNITKGGIYLAEKTVEEDLWQGKVGLVLKKGPNAFVDDEVTNFHGQNVEPGDWVMYSVHDAFQFDIRGVPVRLVSDRRIKMRLADPESIL